VTPTETKMEEALAGGRGKITPNELPQSLKDIYNISNKNRWKNKDKKRNRDYGEGNSSDLVTDAATSEDRGNGQGVNSNTSNPTDGIGWLDAPNPSMEKSTEGSVSFWIPLPLS
jgi:predicted P-loop ATPase